MKNLVLIIILILSVFSTSLFAQTTLSGQVKESETNEPVLFGTVALYQNDKAITGVETDFDGNYTFADLQPGVYDIEASYVGFQTKKITGIKILANEKNIQNISLDTGELITCYYPAYPSVYFRIIKRNDFFSGQVFTSEDIRHSPRRN